VAVITEFAPSFENRVDSGTFGMLNVLGYKAFIQNAQELGATCAQFCALKGSYGKGETPITVRFLDEHNRLIKHRTLRAILRDFAPQYLVKF
jgi:hypothetical protein